MATLRDIAKRAGVSIATVSAVINDSAPVAAKTRQRVREAIAEVGYQPNRAAQVLRTGSTRTILYIVPSVTNLVFGQLVYEIQTALNEHGYDLVIYNNQANYQITQKCRDILVKSRFDGVIVTQTSRCFGVIEEICAERELPLAVLYAPYLETQRTAALCDEVQGAELAVNYLLNHGHRYIGLVQVQGSRLHEQRRQGYERALRAAALQPRILECSGHEAEDAEEVIQAYLAGDNPVFSALLCCNDFMASGAMRALRAAGFAVPDDISVIGFDDSLAPYLDPALTSVSPDKRAMAAIVVARLLEEIQTGVTQPRTTYAPLNLVERDSVAYGEEGCRG